ncbi:uncharacterized protein [Ptychodera flava]|uniref:uncharacterized protein n=1 Tax=Ptychodera flava TaxID=63121 RepID=UPI00396A8351
MPPKRLRPSEIHFVHDTIDCHFQDGDHLLDTFKELLHGNISPRDIKTIAVIRQNGTWYVHAGNRRLFLYKKLEELGVIDYIPVWVVNRPNADAVRERYTTQNRGVSVSVRNDYDFEDKMHSIIDDWKKTRPKMHSIIDDWKKIRPRGIDDIPVEGLVLIGVVVIVGFVLLKLCN